MIHQLNTREKLKALSDLRDAMLDPEQCVLDRLSLYENAEGDWAFWDGTPAQRPARGCLLGNLCRVTGSASTTAQAVGLSWESLSLYMADKPIDEVVARIDRDISELKQQD